MQERRIQEPPPAAQELEALSAGEQAALKEEVLAELRAYYRDFSARDWPAFRDHFWPGANITTLWQPTGEPRERVVATSVEKFIEDAPKGPGSREIFEESMIDSTVQVSRDLAQAWTRYTARFGDPGEVMEWKGTDAFTLLRHDNRWRIAALVFTGDQ